MSENYVSKMRARSNSTDSWVAALNDVRSNERIGRHDAMTGRIRGKKL